MRTVKYWLLLLTLTCSVPCALALDKIRLCQDEIEEAPWRTRDNNGLNTLMLRTVEARLGLALTIENLSWKRCLMMVQHGEMDGAIAASYREDRRVVGAYPATTAAQIPDRNRRMSGEAYFFYKLKDDPFDWNGSTISGCQHPVAAQMGYSAVARLQDKGVRVDDRERKPEHLLRKVVLGLDSAAVLAQGEGDKLLSDPRFAGKIIKLPTPFFHTDGYLLLSHPFVARDPQLAEKIWDSISSVRNSAAYRKELARRGQSPSD